MTRNTTHADILASISHLRHAEVTDDEIEAEYYGVSKEVGHATENFHITSKGGRKLQWALRDLLAMKRKTAQVKADIEAMQLNCDID